MKGRRHPLRTQLISCILIGLGALIGTACLVWVAKSSACRSTVTVNGDQTTISCR